MNLEEFIKKYNNKSVDVDWIYWGQCVDLLKKYTQEVLGITLWTFWGSAKAGWYNTSNTFPKEQWEKIENDISKASQVPKEWDLFFWRHGSYWHCGIVIKAEENKYSFEVFNQNTGNWDWIWYDDRSRIEIQNYNWALGWYRYKEEEQEIRKNQSQTILRLTEENIELKERLSQMLVNSENNVELAKLD